MGKRNALAIVGGIIGGFVTGFTNPSAILYGAQLGYAVGTSMLDTKKGKEELGPRLDDYKQQASEYGEPLGRVWGTMRRAGIVIWAPDLTERLSAPIAAYVGRDGKTRYRRDYIPHASFAVAFNAGPTSRFRRVWFNDTLIYDNSDYSDLEGLSIRDYLGSKGIGSKATDLPDMDGITFYYGTEDQEPDPLIEATEGVGNVPGFRGVTYCVFEGVDITKYGNQRPVVFAEFVAVSSIAEAGTTELDSYNYGLHPSGLPSDGAINCIEPGGFAHLTETYDGYYTHWLIPNTGAILKSRWEATGSWLVGCASTIPIIPRFDAGYVFELDPSTGGYLQIDFNISGFTNLPANPNYKYVERTGTFEIGYYIVRDNAPAGGNNFIIYEITRGYSTHKPDVTGLSDTYEFYVSNGTVAGDSLGLVVADGNTIAAWTANDVFFYVLTTGKVLYQYALVDGGYLFLADTFDLSSFITGTPGSVWNPATTDGANPYTFYFINRADSTTKLYEYNTLAATERTYDLPTGITSTYYSNISVNGGVVVYNTQQTEMLYSVNLGGSTSAIKQSEEVDAIITDIANSCGLTGSQIDVTDLSGLTLRGFISSDGTGNAALQHLFTAFDIHAYEDEGKLFFKQRSFDVDHVIDPDDLGAGVGNSANKKLSFSKEPDINLPRAVNVKYYDEFNEYGTGAHGVRLNQEVHGAKQILDVDLPMVLTGEESWSIAERILYDLWDSRYFYSDITLPLKYVAITPGDLISIDDVVIKVESVEVSDVVAITGKTSLQNAPATLAASGTPKRGYQPISYPGPSEVYLLDIPLLGQASFDNGFYMGAHGYLSAWRGVSINTIDGAAEPLGFTTIPVVAGSCITALGDGPTATIDYTNVVTVGVSGTLESTTKALLLADRPENMAAIGNPVTAKWEIIKFLTATDNGDNTYTISGLIRGLFGTEWATDGHAIGDQFVMLDEGIVQVGQDDITASYIYQVSPFGDSKLQPQTRNFTFWNTGVSLKPYAPAHLTNESDDGAGNYTFTWKRRDRRAFDWNQLEEEPNSETLERYTWEHYDTDGTTLLATGTVDDVTTVTVAGSSGQFLRVAQVSSVYGNGQFTDLVGLL